MAYEASCRSVTSFDVTVKTDNVRRLSMTVDESTLPPASDGSFPELKVQWQRISESEQSTTFIRSRQRYQNGMYRLEVLEIDGDRVDPGELLSAWDNETYKALSSTALRARIRSYARTQIESVGIAYQNSFLVFDGDYSYVDFVRDRPNRSLRVEGELVVITAEGMQGSGVRAGRFGVRLHLDPKRGFMPTRITYLILGSDVPQSEWTNELYEPIEGIWVPRKSMIKVFLRQEDSPYHGQVIGERVVSVDTSHSTFNVPMNLELFSPQIPSGYTVSDERVNCQLRRCQPDPDG